MRFRHVFTIWQKELLDTLRDRRSLMMIVFVPLVIMPIFTLGPSYLIRSQEAETQKAVQEIVVQNGADAPEFLKALHAQSGLKLVERADAVSAVQDGKLALLVVVPEKFEEKLGMEESTSLGDLHVEFNPTKTESQTAREKFEAVLDAYRQGIVTKRLAARGISPQIITPFNVKYESLASKAQVGGFVLSFFLPLFLLIWAAIGGSQTAMDVTVGEKERKTLEALLVTPIGRESLVLGKVLAIFTVTVIASMISLVGFVISLKYGGAFLGRGGLGSIGLTDVGATFTPQVAAIIFLVCAGVAAMMSALVFTLFSWTRSLREAQTHTSWITFAVMMPGLLVQFREITPSLASLFIPLFNSTLVIKELILGQIQWVHIGVTLASLLVYALVSIWIATRVFQNEKVLFRQ